MGNGYGVAYRFTIFGQSHAPAIGVTIEGLPAGVRIDVEALQAFLDRRAPGRDRFSTARKEADRPEILSGLTDGYTCGAPLTAIIRNSDTRSGDYEQLRAVPRPGHADYPAMVRYGVGRDFRGGGQFSGRLTAPLCIAGGIALQMLEGLGISVHAKAVSIGGYTEEADMQRAVDDARAAGDSVGGKIECVCAHVPVGLGEPMFGGMENRIAQAVFGIPAIKGIEFGDGFAMAERRGSENNDAYYLSDGIVRTRTNHAGGLLGGMTDGMPIVFRVVVKPTPSISREQESINFQTGESVQLRIQGRHDPCIVYRAVPCVEAAAAVALYDAYLEARGSESCRNGI